MSINSIALGEIMNTESSIYTNVLNHVNNRINSVINSSKRGVDFVAGKIDILTDVLEGQKEQGKQLAEAEDDVANEEFTIKHFVMMENMRKNNNAQYRELVELSKKLDTRRSNEHNNDIIDKYFDSKK